jgi:hypothetical protein
LGSSVSGGECIKFSTTFSGKEQQVAKVMVIITVILMQTAEAAVTMQVM